MRDERSIELLVASLLLVAMPGALVASLLLVELYRVKGEVRDVDLVAPLFPSQRAF